MSTLLDLQTEIQRTNEAVARAERAVAQHPHLISAQATLRGFIQRQERLHQEFFEVAAASGRDVCRYAIETDDPMPPVRDVSAVWSIFQRLFTTVYDAVTSGVPKQIERSAESVISTTAFGFGFTFAGSIGLVMTVDQGRSLAADTALDDAIRRVFEIMRSRRSEEIIDISRRYGLATVRIAREWASESARARFGANVEWVGTDPVPLRLRLQVPEIMQLENAINRAAEQTEEPIEGNIVGVNYEERTFQMRTSPGGELISGTYEDAVSLEKPAQVPSRYIAIMRVSRRILAQGEQDAISYFLVRLVSDG